MSRVRIQCPFCWKNQYVEIDDGGGIEQDVIEDCQVCCHPIEIHVVWNEEREKYQAHMERSSGFD